MYALDFELFGYEHYLPFERNETDSTPWLVTHTLEKNARSLLWMNVIGTFWWATTRELSYIAWLEKSLFVAQMHIG